MICSHAQLDLPPTRSCDHNIGVIHAQILHAIYGVVPLTLHHMLVLLVFTSIFDICSALAKSSKFGANSAILFGMLEYRLELFRC